MHVPEGYGNHLVCVCVCVCVCVLSVTIFSEIFKHIVHLYVTKNDSDRLLVVYSRHL